MSHHCWKLSEEMIYQYQYRMGKLYRVNFFLSVLPFKPVAPSANYLPLPVLLQILMLPSHSMNST